MLFFKFQPEMYFFRKLQPDMYFFFKISLICTFFRKFSDILKIQIVRSDLLKSRYPSVINEEMLRGRNAMAHLILDPSWFRKDVGSKGKGLPCIINKETADQLERMGRTFCYQVYKRRFELSSNDDDSDTSEDDDDYSLHDTTEESSSDEND